MANKKAMQTILLAKPITAEEALTYGLLCDLFEDGQVLNNTIKVAAELAASGPEALQAAKEAICRGTWVFLSSLPTVFSHTSHTLEAWTARSPSCNYISLPWMP